MSCGRYAVFMCYTEFDDTRWRIGRRAEKARNPSILTNVSLPLLVNSHFLTYKPEKTWGGSKRLSNYQKSFVFFLAASGREIVPGLFRTSCTTSDSRYQLNTLRFSYDWTMMVSFLGNMYLINGSWTLFSFIPTPTSLKRSLTTCRYLCHRFPFICSLLLHFDALYLFGSWEYTDLHCTVSLSKRNKGYQCLLSSLNDL